MMGAAARFEHQLGPRKLAAKRLELGSAEISPQYGTILSIDAVQGERGFGRINSNALKLHEGGLLRWPLLNSHLGTRYRGTVHPNTIGHSVSFRVLADLGYGTPLPVCPSAQCSP